ncbi:thiamine phosphate synthase [Luteibaculum oceani]|uniref:Thiamine-phosphate synthase n=1 Tax=Luteibaculum oceani TaxID=1294296 RepID=A0A5C6V4G9_9FLAO|nr:thiamine phosphate synthase [Luteibaculum oceani]TXC78648.1 thiamine phosphate synthase [Luteibaculum oceani]
MLVSRLHYISQALNGYSHAEMIERALASGVDWVQLRVKNEPEDFILNQAQQARALCSRFGAKLIINDHPAVAKAVGADGVHLGLSDISVSEARKLLGAKAIIGGTCNTYEDVKRRIAEGVDYVGLGPYRFTKTKEKLSPVLGLDGYRSLMKFLGEVNPQIPVIAIGGITIEDIHPLRDAGVHGVALASLINHADAPEKVITEIKTKL